MLILHLLLQNELVGKRDDKTVTYHVAKLLKTEFLVLASCILLRYEPELIGPTALLQAQDINPYYYHNITTDNYT